MPERAYIRVLDLCRRLGATVLARTVVALSDDTMVNFLYRMDGVRSFSTEYKHAIRLNWFGTRVAVMPLQRIIKSKQIVARPKDLAHLPVLQQTLNLKRNLRANIAKYDRTH